MSRNTGPRCGVRASRKASAARAPMVTGSFTVQAAFVTGPSSAGWSNSCNEPVPQRASGARPPTTTIGAPLNRPVARADTALVTPGPAVTAAKPGVRVRRPVASAAKTAVASWRTSSSRTAPSRSADCRSGAASNPCLPPTAASYSGKMWAPERVNNVVAPWARAAATTWCPPCPEIWGSLMPRCFHRTVLPRPPGTHRGPGLSAGRSRGAARRGSGGRRARRRSSPTPATSAGTSRSR